MAEGRDQSAGSVLWWVAALLGLLATVISVLHVVLGWQSFNHDKRFHGALLVAGLVLFPLFLAFRVERTPSIARVVIAAYALQLLATITFGH